MANAIDEQLKQLHDRRNERAAEADEHAQLSRAVQALAALDDGPASKFIAERRAELEKRRDELAPAKDEHAGLQQAIDALEGLDAAPTAGRKPTKGKNPGSGKRGRPKGSGKRSAQALELVRAEPGLGASEIARRIGVHANYAYRILPSLQDQGMIEKRDRAWYPKAHA